MPYDNGDKYVNCKDVEDIFLDCFQDNVVIENVNIGIERKGWFRIDFYYKDKDCHIIFESEISTFNLRIEKDEKFVSLMQLEYYDNEMTYDNIKNAVDKLSKNIKKQILYYKKIGKHLYRENEDGSVQKIF